MSHIKHENCAIINSQTGKAWNAIMHSHVGKLRHSPAEIAQLFTLMQVNLSYSHTGIMRNYSLSFR
jgi:hypothetical protein